MEVKWLLFSTVKGRNGVHMGFDENEMKGKMACPRAPFPICCKGFP